MTPSQKTRFQKISQDMADLLDELRQGAHPRYSSISGGWYPGTLRLAC